jgi:hypothetical protein
MRVIAKAATAVVAGLLTAALVAGCGGHPAANTGDSATASQAVTSTAQVAAKTGASSVKPSPVPNRATQTVDATIVNTGTLNTATVSAATLNAAKKSASAAATDLNQLNSQLSHAQIDTTESDPWK